MLEDFKHAGSRWSPTRRSPVDQNDGTAQALPQGTPAPDAIMLLGYPKAAAVPDPRLNQDWLQAAVGRSDCNPGPAGIANLIGIGGALSDFR
jgi:hypothetical protein